MLFALGSPFALLLLAAGFVAACGVQVGVRRLVERPVAGKWSGPARSRGWASQAGGWSGRSSAGWGGSSAGASGWRGWVRRPQAVLDVFGVVAVLLGGVGWAALPAAERPRGPHRRLVLALLLGCLVDVIVGAALIAVWVHAAGAGPGVLEVRNVFGDLVLQHGLDSGLGVGGPTSALGSGALLLIGAQFCAVGLLALVPLPPLPGGHVLLTLAPTTSGWQKARYYLVEQQTGVAVLVALAVFPLAQGQPLLVFLVDLLFRTLIAPLVGA